jgi:excisionase family DNA binding protein
MLKGHAGIATPKIIVDLVIPRSSRVRNGEVKFTMIGGSNRMLTMRQTAEFLGVAHKTLTMSWRSWELPGYRIGGCIKFRERDLEAWLAKRVIPAVRSAAR